MLQTDPYGVRCEEITREGVNRADRFSEVGNENGAMTMPAVEILETEVERVERWRAEALERAGYTSEAARELAARTDVDLHRAIQLLENGCPPDLALLILR